MSVCDMKIVSLWESSLNMSEGHYELPIPFGQIPPGLENNRAVAESRLYFLKRRLKADVSKYECYKQSMTEMLEKGYAEQVTESEINVQQSDGAVWYLPHHGVSSSAKSDKLRIVFDCAAKYRGVSLNDKVLQGPDLTNKLVGVLMRFREEPIALMADIECMFYQVSVAPRDRNVLRYLWWKDGDLDT